MATAGGLDQQTLAAATKPPQQDAPRQVDYGRLSSALTRPAVNQERVALDRQEADQLGMQAQMPRLAPPPPQQAPSDPLQAFGQPAMWIAAIGSLFTRRPFANAIMAAGSVLQSTQRLDAQAAQQHFAQWKMESENAMKMANYQMHAYDAAIRRIDVDSKAGKAELETQIAAFKDQVLQDAYQRGGINEVKDLLFSRKRATSKAAGAATTLGAHMQNAIDITHGLSSDDPSTFADAFEKWNKHNVELAMAGKGAGGEKAQADLNYTSNEMLAKQIRDGDPDALAKAKAIFGLKTQKVQGANGLTPAMQMKTVADKIRQDNPGMPEDQVIMEAKKKLSTTITDNAANLIADEFLAGNKQAAVGMARSVGNMAVIQNAIAKKAAEKGMDGHAIAAQFADFQGSLAAEKAAASQGTKVGIAGAELNALIPQAREMSKTIPRWDAVPMNKLEQALRGSTSDPDLIAFATQNQAVANAFAQVAARGGQSTDSAREHAYNLLSIARSDAAYQRQLSVLQNEAETMTRAIGEQQHAIGAHIRGGGDAGQHGAQSVQAIPDGATVVQNGVKYRKEGGQFVPVQ
jgi:hypothetical protein